MIWQVSSGYEAELVANLVGSLTLCTAFWFAAWMARN